LHPLAALPVTCFPRDGLPGCVIFLTLLQG